jgi:hypothetical protein
LLGEIRKTLHFRTLGKLRPAYRAAKGRRE